VSSKADAGVAQVDEVAGRAIGDKFILVGGCPKCGSDLEVTHGVCVMCVNWQHPNIADWFCDGGNRSCDYALMSG
jgi:hypothetical protein